MRKSVLILIASVLLLTSCGTYTGDGMANGAFFGSMIGSMIGGISDGRRGSDIGGLIGMAGGAVVGAVIGSAADEAAAREREEYIRDRELRRHRMNDRTTRGNDDMDQVTPADEPVEYDDYFDESLGDNINLILSGNGYMQYPDYDYSEYRCELSVLKNAKPQQLLIGTYGICPVTGDEYSDYGSMTSLGEYRVHCEYCGVGLDEDDAYYDEEGNAYCSDCWNEHFTMCDCCGEWFRNEDVTETQHGEFVCDRCRDRHYVQCCECGEWVPEDDAIYDVDGNWYCEDCAEDNLTRCDDCGEYYHNDDITTFLHPVHGFVMDLCPDCYEQALEDAKNEEEVEAHA